jgi:hypothetical protein
VGVVRVVYKSVGLSLQMSRLLAKEVLAAVKIAVTDVMGTIQFGPCEIEPYKFNGRTHDGFVYQLASIPGLRIKGYSAASSIKMRGYVHVPFEGPQYQYYDASQYARIEICNEEGRELLTVRESTQQGMIDALKSVFIRSTPPASVAPTWAELVERVCEAAKGGDQTVSVPRERLLDLARAMLELLKPKPRGGGGAGLGPY